MFPSACMRTYSQTYSSAHSHGEKHVITLPSEYRSFLLVKISLMTATKHAIYAF